VQDCHLLVGVVHLSLHEGDPHQDVSLVAERQYVNGTAGDVEHQSDQMIAAHKQQQLRDTAPLHHDLLEHLVVPAAPARGRHALEERSEGRVFEQIPSPQRRAFPVDADEMNGVAIEDGAAQARHLRRHRPLVGRRGRKDRESACRHATGQP
jgi:hypothetical protein